jgi:tetratricopeptide (TPR) repeat protein
MKLIVLLVAAVGVMAASDLDARLREGQRLEARGLYEDAAREFGTALPEAERLGGSDARLAITLHNLGAVYRELGRYPEAERSYVRAIALFEKNGPPSALANSLNNLGSLNLVLGRPSRAAALFQRAYDLSGTSLHGLAQANHQMRRYAEAESLYRRAAEQATEPLEAADVAHNWALLCIDTRRPAQARKLLERAAASYQQAAPGHPKLAVILRSLAELDAASGEVARANELFERAVRICEESLPADHPQTGIILQAYAQFLSKTKRKAEALSFAERSRTILSNSGRASGTAYTVDASALVKQ